MTIEQLIANLLQFVPSLLVKLFTVILLFLHLAFSFVLIRQTKVMIRVVEAQISPLLYTISIVHFLSSVFVFVWAIIFL